MLYFIFLLFLFLINITGVLLNLSNIAFLVFNLIFFIYSLLTYNFIKKISTDKNNFAIRQRKKFKKTKELFFKTKEGLNRFIPKEYVSFLKKKQIWEIRLGDSTNKEMAVLFADIRSFTSMAEKIPSDEIFQFLNQFYTHMNRIIEKHNGIIDKFIGDAVLAIFPYRVDDAINCAIDMQQDIQNREFLINNNLKKIEIGIGIHFGEVLLGVLGSENRMQTTVISDVVNTASRLESLSKSYGAPIIISEDVIQNIEDMTNYHIRFLDNAFIRGKEEQTFICEVYNIDSPEQVELKDKTRKQFDNGVIIYQNGEYKESWQIFLKILTINPRDKAAMFFLNRTATYLVEGLKITPEARKDYIIWDEFWETKIDVVDYQHRVLFNLINDLERAINFNIEREALKRILNNLKIYTYTHFTMEEELMLMSSYRDFDAHKSQHLKFIKEIENIETELQTENTNVGQKTLEFLFVWLKSHILKSDKEGYAPTVIEMLSNQKKV